MSKAKFDSLFNKALNARYALTAALFQVYPIGSNVAFKIACTQKVPSTGKVIGAGPWLGTLTIRHDQAKKHSRYACRTVHYDDICHRIT